MSSTLDVRAMERELKSLQEEFRKAELQGKAIRDPGARKYLERKIRQLEADLAIAWKCTAEGQSWRDDEPSGSPSLPSPPRLPR